MVFSPRSQKSGEPDSTGAADMTDDWRSIDAQYEVSRDGRVRKISGEPVGQFPNDRGYMLVRLSKPRRIERVHRLVATAFLSNPDALPEVNHIDGVKANCRDHNLEWCTSRHNRLHATRLRLLKATKLSDDQAISVRERHKAGASQRALAREYGVDKTTIRSIVRGKTYSWTLPSPPGEGE